jgi:copper(I)-binding protein
MRALWLMGLLLIVVGARAQPPADLRITGAWARPDTAGGVSAAYMRIANAGESPVTLIAASALIADVVEIHQTSIGSGGVARMRPVDNGIRIEPGATAALRPGGYHIMLLGLSHDLLPGSAFSLMLYFETADGDIIRVLTGVLAQAEAPEPSPLAALDAWARSAAAGDTSAVYLRLMNQGREDDALLAASSEAAGAVEIHQTSIGSGDVMQMREVAALALPAGDMRLLEPGGYHIMLLDVAEPLTPGDAIRLTLVFESGAALTIGVPVRDPLADSGHNHTQAAS